METEILIVGAGPTGLALATTLQRAGVKTLVAEQLTSSQNTSRAAVIHAHTLEVLEPLGICDRLRAEGMTLNAFSIRDRDSILTRLRFDDLPTRYAHLLMLQQDRTENILRKALGEAGGEVMWGHTVESLCETAKGIEATVATASRKITIRTRYVVGADGMHSMVRQTAGIGFSGSTYEESFVLADVDMTWSHGRDEVMLFFSPAGLVVVAPLPGGQYRIVATLDNAPEQPGVRDLQSLLDSRGPTHGGGKVLNVHWSSRFRLHHRVADHYSRGRLFLVGDAAHVHSPAGGQGMNTGLVDACILGRMLSEVILKDQKEDYLDQYEALRRPAAKQVLRLAGRLTHMATMKGAPQRSFRNLLLRGIGKLPVARRKLELNLSGLSRRDAARVPLVSL